MINVSQCSVSIKNKTILDTVTCTLLPGRITCFVGKSGAGKTTLLKVIGGLAPISKGTITFNDKDASCITSPERAREVGFVFQEFNLFAHMTVLQNCMDPLILQGINKSIAQERALAKLNSLNIADLAHRMPQELSGGQQQRVAIARALCLEPSALLLDEPTASLDPDNSAQLAQILQSLAGQGLAIGLSSQDMSFLNTIFDRGYFIEDGIMIECCEDKRLMVQYPNIINFISR